MTGPMCKHYYSTKYITVCNCCSSIDPQLSRAACNITSVLYGVMLDQATASVHNAFFWLSTFQTLPQIP